MQTTAPAKKPKDSVTPLIERKKFVATTAAVVRQKEHEFMLSPMGLSRELIFELTSLCRTLHGLAQRYVPNTPKTFDDFSSFVQASRKLRGLSPELALDARIAAAVTTADNGAVKSSFEYRLLRNKFIAVLSTIADLKTKSSTFNGVAETGYQRGVREGYRRASEIALLFLEDIENGTH